MGWSLSSMSIPWHHINSLKEQDMAILVIHLEEGNVRNSHLGIECI